MRIVYKYTLEKQDTVLEMPRGAKILSAQMQGDSHCLWAEVDTEVEPVYRRFIILGTGHPFPVFPSPDVFIGTVQDGPYVWHIYEVNCAVSNS